MNLEKRVLGGYIPQHIAIIMDGNGRWAKRMKMPRTFGHKMGSDNLKNIAIICNEIGIKALSVYAFSTENWSRPQAEIDYLMDLPKEFEETFKGQFEKHDIKVMFSGRKDRFPLHVQELIARVEEKTKERKGLVLNICFDYGSYTEITDGVKEIIKKVQANSITIDDVTPDLIGNHLYTRELPHLDFMIRTSGEARISNFLLWQIAYSELYFAKKHWPAFKRKELFKAIDNFQKRNRRFGGLSK